MAELQSKLGVRRVVSAGGAGYKVTQLLEQRAHAYVHRTKIKKWDLCAGDALLRAAGGVLSDWKGERVKYGGPIARKLKNSDVVVASGVLAALTPAVHRDFLDNLKAMQP